MERTIWIIENNKRDLLDMQRKINSFGGMCTTCIFSDLVLKKTIEERLNQNDNLSNPSLILINFNMVNQNFAILEMLKQTPKLAGIPFFFLVEQGEDIDKEEYYLLGAMIVLEKPINQNAVLRICQASDQYEMTKNYERIFQKQASALATAKEIQRLNVQLESRNKFLHRLFGKYFSDELLEVILDSKDGEFIGGDRRNVAILFADLRGFSSKSEELNPDELLSLLNCFFGAMVDIISKYHGTVIEFMGDAILAVFGAPMKNEQFAESAVLSAITMQNAMKEVNQFCMEQSNIELEMGIGIHCGETFIGNIGSEKMMRYNVIGRVVNECSRIESCTTGGQIFISEETLNHLSCDVIIENEATIEAKGIKKPLKIYEISGITGSYNCYLEEMEKEILYPLSKPIILELFLIENKMISKIPILVSLKEINQHNGVMELSSKSPYQHTHPTISIFSDVEVRTTNTKTTPSFSGVYAKVIGINQNKIKLRFTHSNQQFKQYITTLIENLK